MHDISALLEKVEDKNKLLLFLQLHMTDKRAKRFDEVLEMRTRHLTLAIEDVYQERNASAIVRTADCFGIQDVHIIENFNPYQLSKGIAKGADKWVNVYIYDRERNNTRVCIDHLKRSGYRIVAMTPHGSNLDFRGFDIRKKTAFLLGGEKEGLSETAIKHADEQVKIPMYGFTESYNISVAAALLLQDVTRKLHQSETDWHLSEKDKLDLLLKWTIKTVSSSENLIRKFLADKSL